ncbi:hypothetical protein EV356DRAFT_534389 [Viridothelium virens]|uniref:Life-span regulatory factor-domain-containing protein n=1 Tax=Viridothelium virens TaxID=1048519 RepID=A0A6A6H563_VIRVR|nr:hypothetical protein EV356DRAFT_534389 [Viridothelium virens]
MTSNMNHIRNHAKKSHSPYVRGSRPGPLIQRTSYNNKYHHKVSQGSSKNCTAAPKKGEDDDSDVMAASFLQFCPVCEKQIITPSNSVLYCSESCRKKDKTMTYTPPFNAEQTPPTTPFSSTFSFEDLPVRDIIPQRSPTRRSHSIPFSETFEDDAQSHEERSPRGDSEAARYLRQFSTSGPESNSKTASARPKARRPYASSTTLSTMPSLSHTPASSTSTSLSQTPSTMRPLPPRTNPHGSSSTPRGINLVLPSPTTTITSTTTTTYPSNPPTPPASLSLSETRFPAAPFQSAKWSTTTTTTTLESVMVARPSTDVATDGTLLYEKQWPLLSPCEPPPGSLKQLFRFSEMQAPPRRPVRGSTGDLQGLM